MLAYSLHKITFMKFKFQDMKFLKAYFLVAHPSL